MQSYLTHILHVVRNDLLQTVVTQLRNPIILIKKYVDDLHLAVEKRTEWQTL